MTKNRFMRLFILAFTVITIASMASKSWAVVGVNLQGPSYSWSTYPVPTHLDYLKSRGVPLVRLAIAWEKVQPTLNGPLDQTEVERLSSCLDALASREMLAVVCIQNSGRYNPDWAAQVANGKLVSAGTGLALGTTDVPISAFQDLWIKLAGALAGHVGIAGYDLMNEPYDLGAGVWPAAAQAAVNGIRSVDMDTTIYVEGSEWASAYFWPEQNGSLNIIDPADDIIYEAHLYFDGDGSGKYVQTYDEQGAYPNWGVDRLQPFLNWLQQNNKKGFIGEFSVPESDPRWLTVLDNFLATLKQNNLSGTYFHYAYPDPSGAYPWWPLKTGVDYYTNLVPEANGQDKAQWSVLAPYLGPGHPPSAPTGVTAAVNNGAVTLRWTASPWATSYNVYRGTTPGGEGSAPVKTGITATSYTDSVTNGVTYYYQVSATNNAGTSPLSNEVSATPIATFPTVTISAPPYGASYTAPAAVTVTATAAADTGATVSRVDFYAGTTPVGTATTPPYSVTWSNVAAGSYSLTAQVTDSQGEVATSTPVLVSVAPAAPPAITMIAPAIGTSYIAPATIPMSATATPGSGATVSRVEFYAGSTLLGTATAFPYNVTWNNVAAGSYSLTAKLTDSLGGTVTSTAVAVAVTNQALPPPWLTQDVGAISIPGSASYANGTFSLQGNGYDIWGNIDAFRYVYQTLVGDGQIVARVASLQNVNSYAKAGVMIRETLAIDSADAMMLLTAANGARFGYRAAAGGTTAFTALAGVAAPYWVKLVRNGNTFSGYVSGNGVDWVQVGSSTVPMANNVYVGLVVTSHDNRQTCLATMDGVSVTGGTVTSPSVAITAPSSGASYNAPATISMTATATASSGASVSKVDFYAGATLVGTATTTPYSVTWNNVAAGNYSLTAKVTDSSGGTATSGPVPVSVTETVPPSVAITAPASGASYNAPAIIAISATATAGSGASVDKVDFYAGPTLLGTATTPPYSVTWNNVAAGSYTLTARVTDSSGATATSGPVPISVTETALPPLWLTQDVGAMSVPGSASYANGTFSLQGNGYDIWGTFDAFRYVYQTLVGDGQIVARVASLQNTNINAKAGVMIRETLTSGSADAMMLLTAANGARFGYRAATGGTTAFTALAGVAAPYWVKLVRSGNRFSGYVSSNGVDWVQVGSSTVAMGTSVYVGLVVSSHDSTKVCLATMDGVSVTGGTVASPSVTMTAPASGKSYTAPADIPMSATATAGSGASVSKVDFYSGATLVGTAITPPYSVTWNNVPAGSYTLRAEVTDSSGATATSGPVPITVTETALPPPWLTQDVGGISVPGSASYANGSFSLQGSGYDIWGTFDAFRYVYQTLVGDGQIVARVASLQNINSYAKAGVMIRETLTAGSADAMMLLTAANGARFGYRAATGGTTAFTALAGVAAPYWVKLVRSGNRFSGYVSSNGVDWVPVGSGTVAMGNTVYVGLVVSSHDSTKLCLATMDGVSVTGGAVTSGR